MRVLLATISVLLLPLLFQCGPVEMVKLRWFDAFVPTPEESGNFAVLNITEENVEEQMGWPFPRTELARMQEELMEKGALGVGWVISFPQPGRWNGDKLLALVANKSPSVFAMFESPNREFPKTTGTVIMGEDIGGIMATGTIQNTPKLQINEGIVSAPLDVDGLLRRMPLLMRSPDGWIPSFGVQALKMLTGGDTYVIKTNQNGIESVRIPGLPGTDTDSMGRKWISWVVPRETDMAAMDVAGRFVFVGVTAKGVMPQVSTPAGLLYPHHIQAAFAESLINPNSPQIPEFAYLIEISAFIALVSAVFAAVTYLGISLGIGAASGLLLVTGLTGAYIVSLGTLIDVSYTLIGQILAGSVAFYFRFREQWRLRMQIKRQFENYMDPRQVARLQKNPELLKLGGEKTYATFLFTDMRGFTALSEQVTPEEITNIMNRCLTVQTNAVLANEGMVDKFIGDAMMAIWNAPLPVAHHEKKALKAAADIEKGMVDLNKELATEGLPSVQIGIGINTGDAVVGNMGSDQRFDFSAIGDAVNVAARLESNTKEQGVDILVGSSTANAAPDGLTFHQHINVKGKAERLTVYTWA